MIPLEASPISRAGILIEKIETKSPSWAGEMIDMVVEKKSGEFKKVEIHIPEWMLNKWFLAAMAIVLILGFVYMSPGLNTAVFGTNAKTSQDALPEVKTAEVTAENPVNTETVATAQLGVNQLKSVWTTDELTVGVAQKKSVYDDGRLIVQMWFDTHETSGLKTIVQNMDRQPVQAVIVLKDLDPTKGHWVFSDKDELSLKTTLNPGQNSFPIPGNTGSLKTFEINVRYT